MRKVSTKTAERRFFSILKCADAAPVVIERRGRPRAVLMSYSQYRFYERTAAEVAESAAIDALEKALAMAVDGKLGLAHRALKDMRALLGETKGK